MYLKLVCAVFLLIGMASSLPQGYGYNQGRSVPGTEFSGLANGQGTQGFGSIGQGFSPGNHGFGPAGNQGVGSGQGFNHRKGYQEMGY